MVKKKITSELEIYFPSDFINPREKEAYDTLKKRTLLVLDSVVNEVDTSEQIEAIDLQILLSHSPKLFMGSESVEVKYDKQFESMCLLISQRANMDAKRMTVLQFYNAVDTIKQQAEAEMKGSKLKRQK